MKPIKQRNVALFRSGAAPDNRRAVSTQSAISGLSSDIGETSSVLNTVVSSLGEQTDSENPLAIDAWADPPPATIWEAVNRIAARLYTVGGSVKF